MTTASDHSPVAFGSSNRNVFKHLHIATVILTVAATYFLSAKLGLKLAFFAQQVTPVWPPTGIALAALILFGFRVWPGITIGAFLANATADEPVLVAFGIAVGNTLEALVAVWLLRAVTGFSPSFGRLRDVLAFVIVAALMSTTLSATIGVTSLCAGGVQPWASYETLWWVWWLGDATGALVVAPLFLTWAGTTVDERNARRTIEIGALTLATAVTTLIVFGGLLAATDPHPPFEYAAFPFIVLAALRFGPPGVTLVTLVVAVIAVWGTVSGLGPFAGGSVHEKLVMLQAFMGILAVTGLLLAAAILERETAERRRAVDFEVTQVLARSTNLEEAAPRILESICEQLGWDVGGFWIVDEPAGTLRCVETHTRVRGATAEFEVLTRTKTFEKGVGLPGRVWKSGMASWIHDVTRDGNFPRAPVAARAGLHSAFGFPIQLGDRLFGVIEFFSREIRPPDNDLLRMLATVGGQIGHFIERRRAEEALRIGEQRFRLSLGNGAVSVFEQDAQLRYTWVFPPDPAFPDNIIGRTDDELLPGGSGETLTLLKNEVLRTALSIRSVVRVVRPDGERSFDLVVEPQFDAAGKVIGVVGAALDVTVRVAAEGALREADRRKDEFLAILAHELRNPLAPIMNALEILRVAGTNATSVERTREMMERQVSHLVRLVDDLLDVSRITRGKLELRVERVNLGSIVERALETCRWLAAAARHELVVEMGESAILDADEDRMVQAIANLLNNAIKYTPPGGRIRLTAGRQGNEAIFRVQDNGVGIPHEMLHRVFEMFVQTDTSPSRSHGGLGIGLTIVKRLVELHGGSVSASSASPGLGCEFLVRLPIAQAACDRAAPTSATEPALRPSSRRVLVVDDNRDAANSLAELLLLSGHDVRTANDGPGAIEAAREYRPEVVLLDLGMPGMDGYEVARRLRAEHGLEGTALVALTGWGQPDDRRRTQEVGFDHHLTKPADRAALDRVFATLHSL